jgi:catechol 2,3-dioxygenase-like lactoylglutathione lyase family enzyme
MKFAAKALGFALLAATLTGAGSVQAQDHKADANAPLVARHIHIRVMDVEKTKAFYRDKLGLKVTNERPGAVVEFPGLWFGKWNGTGPIPVGGITIGLAAKSVQATYDMLKKNGVTLPKAPAPARDEFAFTFKDPDGYEIEVEGPK